MEAILGALNFNPWTFLFQVVNLLVVIGLLYIILYKPITQMVLEREKQIEGSLADAARAKESAEQMLAEYQARMQAARDEAQEILNRASRMGEEMREELVGKAREEAEKTLARAKAEIEGERAAALAAIREEAANLAVLVAGKVIERNLTGEDQQRLAREFVKEVGELQ